MMKLAVICANGKAGRLIVKEAVRRGRTRTENSDRQPVTGREPGYRKVPSLQAGGAGVS